MTPIDLSVGKTILAVEVERDQRGPPGGISGPIVGYYRNLGLMMALTMREIERFKSSLYLKLEADAWICVH